MAIPRTAEPPQLLPARSRPAGSEPVSTALSNGIAHLAYVSDYLNSAADSIPLEGQLGWLAAIIRDLVDPAIEALRNLRTEFESSSASEPS